MNAVPPPPESDDLIFDTLWSRVMEAWADNKVHAALLDYALRAGRLPDAAGRYRALNDDPEKGEKARKQLDAIVIAATQMMLSMKTPALTKPPLSVTLSAVGVCLILLGWLAYALLRH